MQDNILYGELTASICISLLIGFNVKHNIILLGVCVYIFHLLAQSLKELYILPRFMIII